MNKPLYLWFSKLDLGKIQMHKLWFPYFKRNKTKKQNYAILIQIVHFQTYIFMKILQKI